MFFSVIVPTYNRLPILRKCLAAITNQAPGHYDGFEVIVIDDGSTDGTVDWLRTANLPHVRLFEQNHRGPAVARNTGVRQAQGNMIIFIDSDLVVVPQFLAAHSRRLSQLGVAEQPTEAKFFTYGRVINTSNFEHPEQELFKPTDFSAAFFATGNVAIAKHWLDTVADNPDGPFDPQFTLYGWEDLELGVRLKNVGLKLVKCPEAAGYHWHPPFKLSDLPKMLVREQERGRMGVLFYRKHPTLDVRLMIQMTWLHRLLWGLCSLGGFLTIERLQGLLQWLIDRGKPGWALELSRVCVLNWANVQAVYAAYYEQRHAQS